MTAPLHSAWLRTLAWGVGVLVLAAAVGYPFGLAWPLLALASLGLLAWNLWQLRALADRLTRRRRHPPSTREGIWGEVGRLLSRSQDDMRGRERRLVEMLRAYRAAAAALPDAVLVVDRSSQRLRWFNQAGTTLLGLRYPDDVGVPVAERLQPLPLAHWLSGGRHADPLELRSPVSGDITLSLRLIPYSESLWLLVARDVTRLLRLEQMRRDFVANVSHELRTPLTVVHGYLDMLDPGDNPEWAPMLAEMQKQSQRMTQLVEDLLTLSRLEAQDAPPAEEPVSMAPMLASLRREAQALSQGRHEISVEDDGTVDLLGSTRELHSAFSNLVANAVRYTPAQGSVRVSLRRNGTGALFEVQDSGYGIPAAHLPRITERFYRVSNSRSRESGGTGLGLSIVKHVLQLHQARLEVFSEVGRGSRFACHFGPDRVLARQSLENPA